MSECQSSLLPDHSAQLEKDLEKLQCRVYDQSMLHRDLWSPANCPAELLPWLAWAESVDVWNDRWPDATKRAVIANSQNMHAIKGTQQAVEDSLAALGVRVEVVEWWQESPQAKRGTMKLALWVNNNINPGADVMIDSEMIRDLVSSVDRTKRGCVHYTFDLNVEMHTGLKVAHSVESMTMAHMEAEHTEVRVNAQPFGMSFVNSLESMTMAHMEAEHTEVRVNAQPFSVSFANSLESMTVTHLEMSL